MNPVEMGFVPEIHRSIENESITVDTNTSLESQGETF